MPPLALHTAVAKEVADQLRLPALDNERGGLYLGATAPDIRVITRWERERTHFFDLSSFDEQSGVAGLFHAYPALARSKALNAPTLAFVAGYITHLVMDETWINAVYRPYFGEHSPLGGDLRANVMDRALQFSIDSARRNDQDLMLHVLDAITRLDLGIQVDFIDYETLHRWRDVITDIVSQPPDWERFRQGARRHMKISELDSEDGFEELTRSLPDLVDETLRYLTPERVQAFMDDSLRGSIDAVRGYLRCV